MQTFTFLAAVAASCSTVFGAPVANPNPTNFLLVTTTQSTSTHNSSHLANVSATSLFDEFQENPYLLRLTGPGYFSLPQFNLTNGVLGSYIDGPFLGGPYDYRSAPVVAGDYLEFYPKKETGNLALQDGYLLTVGGKAKGWTICTDVSGASIIYWRNFTSGCTPTYIQAVTKAPY